MVTLLDKACKPNNACMITAILYILIANIFKWHIYDWPLLRGAIKKNIFSQKL